MKRKLMLVVIAVLVSVSIACGAINTATSKLIDGNSNLTVASQLWSDVPKMDGLTPSQMEMPLGVKLVMRTVLGNLGHLNKEGEDKTTGNIDWIVFTTTKTPDDVRNFYSNARMAAQGWETGKQEQCLSGSEQGMAQIGVLCVYQKRAGTKETGLAIIAVSDEQTKQTDVFFLRLEAAGTPTSPE